MKKNYASSCIFTKIIPRCTVNRTLKKIIFVSTSYIQSTFSLSFSLYPWFMDQWASVPKDVESKRNASSRFKSRNCVNLCNSLTVSDVCSGVRDNFIGLGQTALWKSSPTYFSLTSHPLYGCPQSSPPMFTLYLRCTVDISKIIHD
jgi:hypothetical protein